MEKVRELQKFVLLEMNKCFVNYAKSVVPINKVAEHERYRSFEEFALKMQKLGLWQDDSIRISVDPLKVREFKARFRLLHDITKERGGS